MPSLRLLRPQRTALALLLLASLAVSGCALLFGAAVTAVKIGKIAVVVDSLLGGTTTKLAASKADLGRIVAGQTAVGTLDATDERLTDGSYYDTWLYSGHGGETLTVDMTSADFDTYLLFGEMLGGEGGTFHQLAADDDSGEGTNSRLEVTLPHAGTYAVLANAYRPGTGGAYALRVASNRAPDGPAYPAEAPARPLAADQPARGTLSAADPTLQDGSHYHVYRFQGRAGEVVRIALDSDAFDAYLLLARETTAGPEPIARDDDSGDGTNARIEATLPATGPYLVYVNTYAGGETGPYTLTLGTGREAITPETLTDSDPAWDRRYPGGGDPDGRYALLVGIDDYPGTNGDLPSPVADAYIMKRLLVERFGFREQDVVVITDREATRAHILNAFRRHLGQAGPDGVAVFYYSGHGGQMEGNLGYPDDEPDGRDEALWVWANAGERLAPILDDEIGVLTRELRAERTLVVLDACHAGTGTRGADVPPYERPKFLRYADVAPLLDLPDGFLTQAEAEERAILDYLNAPEPIDHVLLAASADRETALAAYGWPSQGGVASVFTYYLAEAIDAAPGTATLQQIMARATQESVFYSKARRGEPQTPQIEGRLGRMTLDEFFAPRRRTARR